MKSRLESNEEAKDATPFNLRRIEKLNVLESDEP
jgi:hypothetical protein